MNAIYLDNAATTPLSDAAACAMAPYLREGEGRSFGNANSLHTVGRRAFSVVEDARTSLARLLGAQRSDELVFTSGATEADNAAIIGIALGLRRQDALRGVHNRNRILVSRVEHDAVLATRTLLQELGFRLDYIDCDRQGRISPRALEAALDDTTLLVSVMTANNEVGTVNPVAALAQTAHARGALFHTDAVQALGKIPINLGTWGVDAACFSGHKVGGPQGTGLLYLKTRTPFVAFMAGGGQERGLRSGTQNLAGIAGLEAAVREAVLHQEAFFRSSCELRDHLYEQLASCKQVVPTVAVAPGADDFLPTIVNVCVKGFDSQTLILHLDLQGICVSGGSACSSNSLAPSHVLTAMGVPDKLAQGSLRISLGAHNTRNHAYAFLQALRKVVGQWS